MEFSVFQMALDSVDIFIHFFFVALVFKLVIVIPLVLLFGIFKDMFSPH